MGGLPPEINEEVLSGRFKPFGEVTSCEIIPVKGPQSSQQLQGACRGFAYVNLEPKDDASLSRCLSMYNGCKWKGNVLRVEKAKTHFSAQLEQEWEDTAAQELWEQQELQLSQETFQLPTAADLAPLHLRAPRGHPKKVLKVEAAAGGKRLAYFPPVKATLVRKLSWEEPPSPPAVKRQKAMEKQVDHWLAERAASKAAAKLEADALRQDSGNDEAADAGNQPCQPEAQLHSKQPQQPDGRHDSKQLQQPDVSKGAQERSKPSVAVSTVTKEQPPEAEVEEAEEPEAVVDFSDDEANDHRVQHQRAVAQARSKFDSDSESEDGLGAVKIASRGAAGPKLASQHGLSNTSVDHHKQAVKPLVDEPGHDRVSDDGGVPSSDVSADNAIRSGMNVDDDGAMMAGGASGPSELDVPGEESAGDVGNADLVSDLPTNSGNEDAASEGDVYGDEADIVAEGADVDHQISGSSGSSADSSIGGSKELPSAATTSGGGDGDFAASHAVSRGDGSSRAEAASNDSDGKGDDAQGRQRDIERMLEMDGILQDLDVNGTDPTTNNPSESNGPSTSGTDDGSNAANGHNSDIQSARSSSSKGDGDENASTAPDGEDAEEAISPNNADDELPTSLSKLEAGATFMRHRTMEQLQDEWQVHREALYEEFKNKRRSALRRTITKPWDSKSGRG